MAGALIASSAGAQTGGLTRVQLLALQQQLKEECGLQHATGRMDGPTRHAIAVCNKKYGTQGNGRALLSAMGIGFDSGQASPRGGMGVIMGNSRDTVGTSNRPGMTARPRRGRRGPVRAMRDSLRTDSLMRADRDDHGHNQGGTKRSDTTFAPVADSVMKAGRGVAPPGNPPKPKPKKH